MNSRKMRPRLRLLPTRWFIIKEADARILLADRNEVLPSFSDLMIAASAQSAYHRPGVVAEARRLATLLDSLGCFWPSVDDVGALLASNPGVLRHYTYENQGDVWYLRSPPIKSFENPFLGNRWCLVWQGPGGMSALTATGREVLEMMRLMPLLGGTHSLEEVIGTLGDNIPARDLIAELGRSGVLEERDALGDDMDLLPEFCFLGHSGFGVRDGKDLLLVDPVGRPENERLGGDRRPFYAILNRASAVLISHHHWDHLDFQSLCRVRRDMPIFVPRCPEPNAANPPIALYLSALGFTDVVEQAPDDHFAVGGLEVRLAPFRGEAFGLGSRFDAFTYHIRFAGRSLYGSVDACHDEAGGMDAIIEEVATWGAPDLFLFGSSEQEHQKPYLAGGLRHFSNELARRPDLLRYHPDFADVARWARMLDPRWLIPYAQFLFDGRVGPDLRFGSVPPALNGFAACLPSKHHPWLGKLRDLATGLGKPVVLLQPMQGIRN